MKKMLMIAVFSAFAVWSCKDDNKDACFSQELQDMYADTVCTEPCTGVCACNDVTYCNECEARKAGFEVADTIPCGQR